MTTSEYTDIRYVGGTDEDIESLLGPDSEVKTNLGYTTERGEGARFVPVRDGLYDPVIFGTTSKKCLCGRKHTEGRCDFCKQIIVRDPSEWIKLCGYYRLSVPYISNIKLDEFIKDLDRLLNLSPNNNYGITDKVTSLWTMEFKVVPCNESEAIIKDKLGYYKIHVLDSQETSNIVDCGLFGIYKIASSYEGLKGDISSLLRYINYNVVIAPVGLRPFAVGIDNKPTYPELSGDYSLMIEMDKLINPLIYNTEVSDTFKLSDKLALAASINNIVNSIIESYPILLSSKESMIRYVNTGRLPHSGRCNIISSDTDFNTVRLPISLVYESIQDDILERLRNRFRESGEDINAMYRSMHPEAIKACKHIVDNSVVVINRAPTLHRYSMVAFHATLWDDKTAIGQDSDKVACIGINPLVCEGFNADFDGDTMSYYIFTKDPQKSKVYDSMCIENNWFYEKNAAPVFVPKDTILLGLHSGTKFILPSELSTIQMVSDLEELTYLYNNFYIEANTVVNLGTMDNPNYVTYGIEKIGEILHRPLKDILGVDRYSECCIRASNVAKISAYIGKSDHKIEMMNEIFKCGNEWASRNGTKLIRLDELFEMTPDYPEIEEILNSNKSEKQKYIELMSNMENIVKTNIKKRMPTLEEQMSEGGMPVKMASLVSTFMPQVSFTNGVVEVSYESLNSGLGTEALVHSHLTPNREILHQKADLVPTGGYLTRQVVDLERNYIYKPELTSTDKVGIEVRKIDAYGRTRLDGSEVGSPVDKDDAESLVRIKSSIYTPKFGVDQFYVKSDELNKELYKTEQNAATGISVATSTTESITQAQLGLKHGGTLFVPAGADKDDQFLLRARKNYDEVKLFDDHCELRHGFEWDWYPVPRKHIYTLEALENNLKGPSNSKGTVIYYFDEMHYIDYNIARIIDVIGANKSSGSGFDPNKTKYTGVECFSIDGGKIHYDLKSRTVTIGDRTIRYSPDLVYYFPEGYEVPKYTQFCSGTLNPKIIRSMTTNHEKRFYLFYAQLKKLIPGMQLLSIELLFRSLFNYGSGSIKTSIGEMDPIITMGHEKATKSIKSIINKDLKNTLALSLVLYGGDRSRL
jgi:hypothetical protein